MTPAFASPNTNPRAGSAARREIVRAALEVLAAEGCVAFPSETVWGLAASARSPVAVAALGAWKGRADGQPISVLVSGESALRGYGFDLDPLALSLMERFWPGPLTLVLSCRSALAPGIARADGSVGVRCSSHPVAVELVEAAEASGLGPLTATSCNRSGAPPARTESEARVLCSALPDGPYVLAAGNEDAGAKAPTTVLDLTVRPPRILREGGVSATALRPFLEKGNFKRMDGLDEPERGDVSG